MATHTRAANHHMKALLFVLATSTLAPQMSFARDHEPNFWKTLQATAPVSETQDAKESICSDMPCCEKMKDCCKEK